MIRRTSFLPPNKRIIALRMVHHPVDLLPGLVRSIGQDQRVRYQSRRVRIRLTAVIVDQ